MNGKWFLILMQPFFLGCLGSPDSCYYCSGTRQCKDPMDFNEVSPRKCNDNSVCVKYLTTSQNTKHEVVAHQLTYRKCKPWHKKEGSCNLVKKSEERALRELNLTLTAFECYECDETNCNSGNSRQIFVFLVYIVIDIILLTL